MSETVILWFKRDLRLADHSALARALALGRVVPLYIVEPGYWRQPEVSGRHYAFLRETIQTLRTDLRARGSDLVLRVGEAVTVLGDLQRETGARMMVSHEETGTAWTYARDRAVGQWARTSGLRWEEHAQSAVIRGPHNRDNWGAARNRFMAVTPIPAPASLPAVRLSSDPLPSAEALGLADDPCPGRQPGGRGAALRELDSFLHVRGQDYRRAMSSPLTGASACSRLSPHLALGALSLREAVQATAGRQRALHGTGKAWTGSLKSLQSRLAWRDHFIQKLEDDPELDRHCLHSAYEGLRPATPGSARLAAWKNGETGVPFVDACMRSLQSTGWLNFRMRSMVMSFASYHLWLDWRVTGQHLARMFTDYEPGIHWSQCQMQSGTTGINTLRIYNPVKQGHEHDPKGVFTRRWCPELEAVPAAYLQEPWRWEGRADYPAPLVDLVVAARQARERIWAVRSGSGFRAEAAEVVRKHASRKDPQRHFVNDRAQKKRPQKHEDRQLRFDL